MEREMSDGIDLVFKSILVKVMETMELSQTIPFDVQEKNKR